MPKLRIVLDKVTFDDDDISEAMFIRKLCLELLPQVESDMLDMKYRRLSPTELCRVIREALDGLGLMHAGLDGERKRRFEATCASLGFSEVMAKYRGAVARAEQMLAQRQAQ
jgi:hypothetical protein